MDQIGQGIHHLNKRKRIYQKKEEYPSEKGLIKAIDKLVYVFGIIATLMTLPQVIRIWIEKNVSGVSILTWGTYLMAALFWIFYGKIHKEKTIIFVYSLALILDALIVIGLIIHM